MQSRRDKLYIQPWEERRYKDHRCKVSSALPAIDCRAPPPRPHVATKLKKWQREAERTTRVQKENFALLQRLNDIMKINRLDNHWVKPQPSFHHKVGVYFDVGSLNSRLTATARSGQDASEDSYTNVRCYACACACEVTKKPAFKNGCKSGRDVTTRGSIHRHGLPSIYSHSH